MGTRITPLRERFESRYVRGGPDICWNWQGVLTRYGYGQIAEGPKKGKTLAAHRLAYEFAKGPIPPGASVCHRCDNPPCVNPNHLFIGTNDENIQDKCAKGRSTKGEKNGGGRKLTADDVRAIRLLLAEGIVHRVIGEKFGVSASEVWLIKHRRHWAHVE